MLKKVIVAGLLGGAVLIVWTFLVNGILGFQARIDMKQLPAERHIYETLKDSNLEPGRYTCNPAPSAEGRFPDSEPVFSILYGGMGHEAAGGLMLSGLVIFVLAPMIGAWLLSMASTRILSSYWRKVLFFTAIGLLCAVFGDLAKFGIGGYPLGDAVTLAFHSIVVWTVVGLVVAWRIRPEGAAEAR
ncbi:MAG TPA: hypothetical protein VMX58_06905 [Patescibacteria group bacterium]|nr:hypothetical protein [Patescibacteria group bacterium]